MESEYQFSWTWTTWYSALSPTGSASQPKILAASKTNIGLFSCPFGFIAFFWPDLPNSRAWGYSFAFSITALHATTSGSTHWFLFLLLCFLCVFLCCCFVIASGILCFRCVSFYTDLYPQIMSCSATTALGCPRRTTKACHCRPDGYHKYCRLPPHGLLTWMITAFLAAQPGEPVNGRLVLVICIILHLAQIMTLITRRKTYDEWSWPNAETASEEPLAVWYFPSFQPGFWTMDW